jgi:hypothetical protein
MKISWNSITFTLLSKIYKMTNMHTTSLKAFMVPKLEWGPHGLGGYWCCCHIQIKRLYLNMKIPMVSSSHLCISLNIKNIMWFEWQQVLNSFIHMCFYRGTWLEGLAYGSTNIVIFEVWWSTYYCTIISLLPNITKINNIKPMNKWYLAYLFMWTIWGKEQHWAHVQAHIQHHVIIHVKRPHMFGGYGFNSKFHINSIASEFWNCEDPEQAMNPPGPP